MKRWGALILIFVAAIGLSSCGDKEPVVTIHTSYGDMKVVLFNQTPAHKESFVRLANDGGYDSTIFHRVISQFMIQGGDRSRLKPGLEDADLPFEYVPELFHRKGALAGARMGERSNPERNSGTQWYIVQGQTYNEADAQAANAGMTQQGLNTLLTMLFSNSEYEELRGELMALQPTMTREEFGDQLYTNPKIVEALEKEFGAAVPKVSYTPEQLEVYANEGGTPHLDGGYTVFGQVIQGMDIIDKIAQVETVSGGVPGYTPDQPKEDVTMYMTVELMTPKQIEKKYGYVFPGSEEK